MENFEDDKLTRARKKVKDIRGFYTHLTIYLLVNVFLVLARNGIFYGNWYGFNDPFWTYLTTPFFWGIGILGHALHVFQHKITFFKNWEQRKIEEYMKKDEEDFNNTTKWN